MEFLNTLAGIRTPFLTLLARGVTLMGEEVVLVLFVLAMLWCVNKRNGYRLAVIAMVSIAVNTLIKMIFAVERPWMIQPGIAVEAALGTAQDYSFPSGHTQNATVIFLSLALMSRKKWTVIPAVILSVLVAFSRMYLGVHTPQDVAVGFALGIVCSICMSAVFRACGEDEKKERRVAVIGLVFSLIPVIYCLVMTGREGRVASADDDCTKNAWTVLFVLAAVLAAWTLDAKRLHYDTKAVWWAQAAKLAVGAAAVLAIRTVLKAVLPATPLMGGIRYLFAVGIPFLLWPLTFPRWQRLGQRGKD